MSPMMDHCSAMMRGGHRPNEQWREQAPEPKG
jgi:hypothetical protein